MSTVKQVLDGSETESKSGDLSSGEEWSELSSRPSSDRSYRTYKVSGMGDSGTLRGAPEGFEDDFDAMAETAERFDLESYLKLSFLVFYLKGFLRVPLVMDTSMAY